MPNTFTEYEFTDEAGDCLFAETSNRTLLFTSVRRGEDTVMVDLPEEEARKLKDFLNRNFP